MQDVGLRPLPGALADECGIRSYYLLELTGLARGVLLVAHTDAAPRGFTLLCRRLGARLAEVGSAGLGVALTREWIVGVRRRVFTRRSPSSTADERYQQRRDQQRHHVEPDVAGGDARRRVAVRDAEVRDLGRPAPGADRRAVELERGDDEEDAGVDRAARERQKKISSSGIAERAGDVAARDRHQAEHAPGHRRGRRRRDDEARVPLQRERERDAGQEDEPVRGRHEHRQVVQPVGVEAPDQRAGHLADRREDDHAERLRPPLNRDARQPGDEHDPGQPAERELLRVGRVVVDREQRREVGGACRREERSASPSRSAAAPVRAVEARRRPSIAGGLRYAPVLQLVPRRHRCQLEEWTAAAGMLVGELGLDVVPDDLERAALDLVVEPGAAEDELAQPVDERLAADERDALPVAREVAAEPRLGILDQPLRRERDEVARLLLVELVRLDEPELDRRRDHALLEVEGVEGEAEAEELDDVLVAGGVVRAGVGGVERHAPAQDSPRMPGVLAQSGRLRCRRWSQRPRWQRIIILAARLRDRHRPRRGGADRARPRVRRVVRESGHQRLIFAGSRLLGVLIAFMTYLGVELPREGGS